MICNNKFSLWKDTLNDGMIPVKNFTEKEMQKSQLKNYQFDTDFEGSLCIKNMSFPATKVKFYKCDRCKLKMVYGNTRSCGWVCNGCSRHFNSNPGFYWCVCNGPGGCGADFCNNCFESRACYDKKEGYQAENPDKFSLNMIVFCLKFKKYSKIVKCLEKDDYLCKMVNEN